VLNLLDITSKIDMVAIFVTVGLQTLIRYSTNTIPAVYSLSTLHQRKRISSSTILLWF